MVHWPKTKKRAKAEKLLSEASLGKGDLAKAKLAFESAAKEAHKTENLSAERPLSAKTPDGGVEFSLLKEIDGSPGAQGTIPQHGWQVGAQPPRAHLLHS